MKFAISPEDKLALVISLTGERITGVEAQDSRITAWEDLGVRPLARLWAQRLVTPQAHLTNDEITSHLGKKLDKKQLVDLQPTTIVSLVNGIAAGVPGPYLDQLTDVRRDLERLRNKTYELPRELRGK